MMKNKRGQKSCTECGTVNGARSFECKQCGAQFKMKKFKKGSKRKLIKDHTILQRGDTIYVVSGSGPYYQDGTGERVYLVDRGKYSVVHTDNDGISAYGASGYEYIYMGKTCKSKLLDNITKAPCKVLLLKTMSHSN